MQSENEEETQGIISRLKNLCFNKNCEIETDLEALISDYNEKSVQTSASNKEKNEKRTYYQGKFTTTK